MRGRPRGSYTEQPGNFRCYCPKVGVGPTGFVSRKQPTLLFPLAKRLDISGTIFLAMHAHDPFFGHSLIIQHHASRIQHQPSNETAACRWSLLRLSLIFRYSESLEFEGGTNERNFWIYKNLAADGQTFAAGVRRSGMGRRRAAETSGTAARLQRDAQRDAEANGPAARLYPKTHSLAGFSKYLSPGYRGR